MSTAVIPQKSVSATALLIAAARARETARQQPSGNSSAFSFSPPLFVDPFAAALAGSYGQQFLSALIAVYGNEEDQVARFAVRTKWVDDKIAQFAQNLRGLPRVQLVMVGVGVDTRAYRLSLPNVHVYEVDLPCVIEYRQQLLPQATVLSLQRATFGGGFTPAAAVHAVAADITSPSWCTDLVQCAGYEPACPTLFVVEGVLMYLSMEEVTTLLSSLRALAAPGSALVGNCIASTRGEDTISLWSDYYQVWSQYAVAPSTSFQDPVKVLSSCGWTVAREDDSEPTTQQQHQQVPFTEVIPLGHQNANYGRLPPLDIDPTLPLRGVVLFCVVPT